MTPKVEIIHSKSALADGKPSKGELKRKMERLQELGERLTKISDGQLGRLDLPDELLSAVLDARKFSSRAALRRQIQFIGRLMEFMDAAKIARDLNDVDVRAVKAGAKETPADSDTGAKRIAYELVGEGVDILFSKYAGIFDNVTSHQIRGLTRQAIRNIKDGANAEAEISKLADKLNPLVPSH